MKEKEERNLLPLHLHKIHTLCPKESIQELMKLFQYFDLVIALKGKILWQVGDESNSAILLCLGTLQSNLFIDEEKDENDINYDKFGKSDTSEKKEKSENEKNEGTKKMTEIIMQNGNEEDSNFFEEISVGHLIGKFNFFKFNFSFFY